MLYIRCLVVSEKSTHDFIIKWTTVNEAGAFVMYKFGLVIFLPRKYEKILITIRTNRIVGAIYIMLLLSMSLLYSHDILLRTRVRWIDKKKVDCLAQFCSLFDK